MGAFGEHPPRSIAARAAVLWFVLSIGTIGTAFAAQAASSTAAGATQNSADTTAIDTARKLVAEGKLSSAIAGLAAYVGAHAHHTAPARYLGDLYYRSANYAAAERTYQAILRDSPNDRETHNQLGGVYAFEDRVPEAINEFTQSLPLTSAFEYLIALHRERGDLDAFVAPFRRAADEDPDNVEAQLTLGTLYHGIRRTEQATTYLERAAALEPRACPVLAELGSAYIDLQKYDAATSVLKRCLAVEPDNYPALVNLGDTYVARDEPSDSLSYFEHANRVRPDGPEAIIDLGYLQDAGGHWQAAVADYLKALAIQPLSLDAYGNLGYDYDSHNLYSLAEAAFLKGLSMSPSDGRLHFLLGRTYAEQGKHDLARAQYQLAARSEQPEVAQAARQQLAHE